MPSLTIDFAPIKLKIKYFLICLIAEAKKKKAKST